MLNANSKALAKPVLSRMPLLLGTRKQQRRSSEVAHQGQKEAKANGAQLGEDVAGKRGYLAAQSQVALVMPIARQMGARDRAESSPLHSRFRSRYGEP